jgi:hypothetical protein
MAAREAFLARFRAKAPQIGLCGLASLPIDIARVNFTPSFIMFIFPSLRSGLSRRRTPEVVAVLGRYNEKLQKASVLLALDGQRPPGTA